MPTFNEVVMAVGFVGAFVICPLTFMFLWHQRTMMEMMHKRTPDETLQRLEAIERQLQALTAAQQERVLKDDDRQELHRRVT
jgi:hypothetical protein